MFNLPLPTDSLYKFCFTFGLLLIVFSFYFRDNHLNEYDTKQSFYLIDSLNKKIDSIHSKTMEDTLSVNRISDDVEFFTKHKRYNAYNVKFTAGLLKESFQNSITEDNLERHRREILSDTGRISIHPMSIISLSALKDELVDLGNQKEAAINKKLHFYNGKVSKENVYFTILISVGTLLFFLGITNWYFKIQRPQDQLLIIQLTQAKQAIKEHPKLAIGRRHIDPINLKSKKIKP